MTEGLSTPSLIRRLLVVVVVMFCFGVFVLPPLYDVMCQAFGINGKTNAEAYQGIGGAVDESRSLRVQFVSTNAEGMTWTFGPEKSELMMHPGETHEMVFIAHNTTDKPMVAQAIPSISPSKLPPTSIRPSASALPSRFCSRGNGSRCRCASSSMRPYLWKCAA